MMKQNYFNLLLILSSIGMYAQTAGNVGIKTSKPTNTLTVNGNSSIGAGYTGIAAPANGAIIQGNVGVGTSKPVNDLTVSGNTSIGAVYAAIAAPANGAIIQGNVGVGTAKPVNHLTVSGNTSIGAGYAAIAAPANGAIIQGNVGVGTAKPVNHLTVSGNTSIGAGYAAIAAPANGAIIQGNVGVGTAKPVNDLTVSGNTSIGAGYAAIAAPANGAIIQGNVGVGTAKPVNDLTVSGNTSIGAGYAAIAAPANGAIIQGNMGVGTATPKAKLDIIGKIKITDGTQGEGKILTSDVNGLASWAPAPGSLVITGQNNMPSNTVVINPPTTQLTLSCPITLNKGIYILYFYAQYDYLIPGSTYVRQINPSSSATISATFPRYVYLDFVASSGSVAFPSYPWLGQSGPHVVPIISWYQAAGKMSQLVIVKENNTVIRPKIFGIPAYGRITNIGPITAVKM